jgi:regulator of CtrA degradation
MSNNQSTGLLSRVYNDALALLRQSREYVHEYGQMDFMSVSIENGLALASETSRITSRLTQIVAWYLTQEAYLKGEIDLNEARSEEYKVEMMDSMLDDQGELNPVTPETLKYLLKSSRNLYLRVARLDEFFRRNTAQA